MKTKRLIFIIVLVLLLVWSCEKKSVDSSLFEVDLSNKIVESGSGVLWINITSAPGGAWTIEEQNTDNKWYSLKKKEDKGKAIVAVIYKENATSDDRTASFLVCQGDVSVNISFKQLAKGKICATRGKWIETPSSESFTNTVLLRHYVGIKGLSVRNYTVAYDTLHHFAQWVAYPMHSLYLGPEARTDNWQYDPNLPVRNQPNMGKAMGIGFDRGHMLPSGSRKATKTMNSQTFYFTNIVPQVGENFNRNIWADLENRVREISGSGKDTLYVVTGAVLNKVGKSLPVKTVITKLDNEDIPKPISVPNYFYKALLQLDSQGNPEKAICFWLEHKEYIGDSEEPYTIEESYTILKQKVITIDQLEEYTGLDFFKYLDNDTQERLESTMNANLWIN
ncbi:MAG: DNA/RNA non-specific endonuclease [Bacteroidales bacterium]